MVEIALLDASYDVRSAYLWELDRSSAPDIGMISNFDKVGYNLTKIEMEYAFINGSKTNLRASSDRYVISSRWFSQGPTNVGAILSSAMLLERKGYDGSALNQLIGWCNTTPIFYKLANIKPRWGFEFSMDWISQSGTSFEILHQEFHGTILDTVDEMRKKVESKLSTIDWDDAAAYMMRKIDSWKHLDLQSRRDFKSELLGFKPSRRLGSIWDE